MSAIKNKEKRQHIKVFVRVRPLNSNEKISKSASIIDCNSAREIVVKDKTFTFDKVFGPASSQVEVYKSVTYPLIKEVLDGYNCTVFAYGQTGTGKTFTMEGDRSNDSLFKWHNDPLTGIIPRALGHLFDELRLLEVEYSVRVSFLELYNEELFDLLSPVEDNSKLRLYEDITKKGSVIINGLEEVSVATKDEVYHIMEKGAKKRQTAATLMNARSSRSHTVFSITVHIKENTLEGEELLKTGKLNLVDLAGSENIGRSGAVDKRAREAGNINQSLLTLGRVITALVERAPHVPYRESKLTRLLQESLGGRTKTSIIATISPAFCNMEETLSTLDYAHRAKNIQNKPEVNQKIGKIALIKEYTEEIERLKRDLLATREKSGIYLAEENYQAMIQKIESQDRELTELLTSVKSLNEVLEKKEELTMSLNIAIEENMEKINALSGQLNQTNYDLSKTKDERDETEHLLDIHMKTEEKLSEQAHDLLSVASVSTVDTYLLHNTLDRKRFVEEVNLTVCKTFEESLYDQLKRLLVASSEFEDENMKSFMQLKQFLSDSHEKTERYKAAVCEEIDSETRDKIRHIGVMDEICTNLVTEGHGFTENLVQASRAYYEKETKKDMCFFDMLATCLRKALSINALQKKEIDELRTESFSKIAENEKSVHEAAADIRRQIHEIRNQVQKQEQQMVSLQNSMTNLTEKKGDLLKVLQGQMVLQELQGQKAQQIIEMQNQINQNMKNLQVGLEVFNPDLLSIESSLESLRQCDITAFLDLQEQDIASVTTSSLALKDNLHTCIDKFSDNALSSVSEEETLHSKVLQCSHDEREERKEMQNQHLNITIKELESISKNHTNLKESMLKEHQLLLASTSNSSEAHKDAIEKCLGDLKEVVVSSKNSLSSWYTKAESWKNSLAVQVENCISQVHKFVAEDVMKDTPSGNTPQRREFSYPQQLVATSPHDRILARYRVAREELKLAEEEERKKIEDAEKVEEEEERSPVSSSDGSSSASLSSDSESTENEKLHPRKKSRSTSDVGQNVTLREKFRSESSLFSSGPLAANDKENSLLSSVTVNSKIQREQKRPVLSDHNE